MNELGPEARELIARVGDSDGPTRRDRERIRRLLSASLGAASTVASGASLAAGSASVALLKSVGVSKIVLWLCVGSAVGTAITVPFAMRERPAVSRAAPRAQAPRVPRSVPRRPTPPAAPPPSETAEPTTVVEPPLAPLPTAAVPVRRSELPSVAAFPEPRPSVRRTSLGDETRVLERAQQARAQGRPDQALQILAEYSRRFPAGALASESLAAQVLSLCELGRTSEAQTRAEQLLRSDPESPYVPRLSRTCVRLPTR